MESKKINQLATNLAPLSTDLTIVGDPITGVSKKITLSQIANLFAGSVDFYANLAAFPATGTINIIYCAKDTQKLYLWSGSAYVETFPSQAVLNTYQLLSAKGVANGYASLDSGGKVPIAQLPSSIMEYKGLWSAATNTPTLANGTGDTGDVYICSAAGSVNFGAGAITFAIGDYVIYSGTIWQRSSGAVGTVTSVGLSTNGNSITIGSSPVTTSATITANFVGDATQYINGAGNLTTFPTLLASDSLVKLVRNQSGATMTAGTVIYISGATGNKPLIAKALATGDATSAQTYGLLQTDIANNADGYVVVIGNVTNIDTSALTEGQQLYLSGTTAGTWTTTKPYAPIHLVYVGIVLRAHPTQGIIGVKIQNGYEMDELHNVDAYLPNNNDILSYNTTTSLWEHKQIATTLGYTPANDASVVHLTGTETVGGTKTFSDATKNNGGIFLQNASSSSLAGYMNLGGLTNGVKFTNGGGVSNSFTLPSSTGYTFTFPNATGTLALTSDLTGGTVTSVAMTVPTGLSISGSPITTSGTLAVSLASGYSIPTTSSQATWDTAYSLRITTASLPLVLIGNLISMNQATALQNGFLTYTDFQTFNNKQNAITLTTTGTSGAATFSSNTLNIPNYAPDLSGYVTLAGTQTITGAKTFSTFTKFDGGVILKNNVSASLVGYVGLSAYSASGNKGINIDFDTYSIGFYFNGTLPYQYTFPAASGTIALVGGSGVGTVTSVAALTIGTSGTDLSSTVATSTTTPVITLNVPTASATNRGALSSADWSTFNGKQAALTIGNISSDNTTYVTVSGGTGAIIGSGVSISVIPQSIVQYGLTLTTTGTSGAATFIGSTLNIPNYTPDLSGYVTLATTQTISGAKTFSSYIKINRATTAISSDILFQTNGTDDWFMGTNALGTNLTDFYLYRYGVGSVFSLSASTGAATFTSPANIGTSAQLTLASSTGGLYGTSLRLDATALTGGNVWQMFSSAGTAGEGQGKLVIGLVGSAATMTMNGGNVGIGTSSPQERFEIAGLNANIRLYGRSGITQNQLSSNVYYNGSAWVRDNASYGAIAIQLDSTNGILIFNTTAATSGFPDERMRITSGGNVLIGTNTDATGKLQVNGTVYATGFYESSDIRFKNILETNPNVNVLGIDVIKFTRKDNDTNQVRYGYSAQQVHSILPDAVTGTDFLNVNYLDVHTLKIAQLEKEIKELKSKMN
jgi:hypothetical protein